MYHTLGSELMVKLNIYLMHIGMVEVHNAGGLFYYINIFIQYTFTPHIKASNYVT